MSVAACPSWSTFLREFHAVVQQVPALGSAPRARRLAGDLGHLLPGRVRHAGTPETTEKGFDRNASTRLLYGIGDIEREMPSAMVVSVVDDADRSYPLQNIGQRGGGKGGEEPHDDDADTNAKFFAQRRQEVHGRPSVGSHADQDDFRSIVHTVALEVREARPAEPVCESIADLGQDFERPLVTFFLAGFETLKVSAGDAGPHGGVAVEESWRNEVRRTFGVEKIGMCRMLGHGLVVEQLVEKSV